MEVMTCMKKIIITASMVLILLVPFLFGGCATLAGAPDLTPSVSSTTADEGFAIYLTRDNVPIDTMKILSHVEVEATPVISSGDIIAYLWETQEIQVTAEAWKKIQDIHPPTKGTPFIVCVNKSPVYWGAFWTPVSSQSFNGVIIQTPALLSTQTNIKIELGYPSPDFYQGEDPRFSPDVITALEKAGKLK
jgi:hypothetical protein